MTHNLHAVLPEDTTLIYTPDIDPQEVAETIANKICPKEWIDSDDSGWRWRRLAAFIRERFCLDRGVPVGDYRSPPFEPMIEEVERDWTNRQRWAAEMARRARRQAEWVGEL